MHRVHNRITNELVLYSRYLVAKKFLLLKYNNRSHLDT